MTTQETTAAPGASRNGSVPWFRLYNSMLDDPKVQKLPDGLFKALINLWCIASQNGGVLPPTKDVAYRLRVRPAKASEIVTKLVAAGLLDNDGGAITPHNWSNRQFHSDSSTERSRRSRGRSRNVAATPPEQNRSEQTTAEAGAGSIPVEQELRQAIARAFAAAKIANVPDTARAALWLSQGYDAGIILAVITDIIARMPNVGSLNYFDGPIRTAHQAKAPKRLALSHAPAPQLAIEDAVKMFAGTRVWSRHAGPEPGLAGCRASPELLARYGLLPDGRAMPPSTPRSTCQPPTPAHAAVPTDHAD
jgi:hypothetical protein